MTAGTIAVQVRYFASLREALGPSETVSLPPGSTLGALRAALVARGGRHAEALGGGRPVRSALDLVMRDDTAVLAEGSEVAFFPPVTGG
jgi:molybdopterin synthase sulfur carrier subunit